MTSFSQFDLPPFILNALTRMNITVPTPVQAEAISPACQGRDILATAQTGTGKTIAYLVPLLTHLHNNKTRKALILTPTRELAIQVKDAVMQLSVDQQFKSVLLIGGEPIFKQIKLLRHSAPRIIIGTPGRIIDHLQRGLLTLDDATFFVLDEVDRMLDMGFSAQLAEIQSHLTSEIQTLMFSATMPQSIRLLAQKSLKDPCNISVGSTTQPTAHVKQDIVHTKEADKYACLEKEIEGRDGSIFVFVETKRKAELLADRLKSNQHLAEYIHGDLRQQKRALVINRFRKGHEVLRIMVATDVAARGIDVPHVQHVVNYDLPRCPEDYVHRIGRTGRAGTQGYAVSFVTPSDNKQWNNIVRFMNGQQYTSGREYSNDNNRNSSRNRFGNNNKRDNYQQRRPSRFDDGGGSGSDYRSNRRDDYGASRPSRDRDNDGYTSRISSRERSDNDGYANRSSSRGDRDNDSFMNRPSSRDRGERSGGFHKPRRSAYQSNQPKFDKNKKTT